MRPRKLSVCEFESRCTPATFAVTSAADSGANTLRDAILAANLAAGADTITFAIPGALAIDLITPLPAVTGTLIIDGTTQTGYDPVAKLPVVELDGNSLAGSGLVFQAANCQVLGLNIHNFGTDGIRLESSAGLVTGCFVGTDRTGKLDRGNGDDGITVTGGNNTIRDSLISGNQDDGIELQNSAATGNSIRGNRIGTDVTGTVALGNAKDGVHIHNAPFNTVGGGELPDRNIISANGRNTAYFHHGVHIDQEGSDSNTVSGNYIGTDITGTKNLGNGVGGGIRIDSGPDANLIGGIGGAGNVISGNQDRGITIASSSTNGTVVIGNIIGLNAAGTAKLPNADDGIGIGGGPSGTRIGTNSDGVNDDAERNVISGNSERGVEITGTAAAPNTVVAGNLIGTNLTGDLGLGNDTNGIYMTATGSGAIISGNVISSNGNNGIQIRAADNVTVQGNRLGVNKAGTAALPNTNDGIVLDSGAASNTIGGAASGLGNIISGNGRYGIRVTDEFTDNNVIINNLIGTDASGLAPLGNSGRGILIDRSGKNAILNNVIRGNGQEGVLILGATAVGNAIRGNALSSNGGLGIDLSPSLGIGDGPTANDLDDADTGPNGFQNFPVIAAVIPGFTTRVIGSLATTPGSLNYSIDLYASLTAEGEGQRFLGTIGVATVNGAVSFNQVLPAATSATEWITATATDAAGNTSEFSLARAPVAAIANVSVNLTALQRSRVTSLEVNFNKPVTLPAAAAAAFELRRQSDNALIPFAASFSGTVATLTFLPDIAVEFGSLADGRYTLTVLANQVNAGDFDGNGDGFAGDNYTLVGNHVNKLFRLFGDINGDGTVDGSTDFAAFGNTFGTTAMNSPFDFNNDGTVDGSVDFAQFGARFGVTL